MALYYAEFKTTGQYLMSDLATQIANCSDWAKQNSTASVLTTSASVSAGATSLPFTATGSSGWAVGKIIRIGAVGAADTEYRKITSISGTAIGVAALTYAHSSGTNVYDGAEIYKATTTRGADMVVDFMDDAANTTNMAIGVYRSVGGDKNGRQFGLYYKGAGGGAFATNAIYVTLSISKEHLFISMEGPRPADGVGYDSSLWGSVKTYFFICDLVPYFSTGIDPNPAVVCGGWRNGALVSAYTGNDDKSWVNRNIANTNSWQQGSLMTLEYPFLGGIRVTESISPAVQKLGPDGNYYLSPYVYFDDAEGLRGRLNNIYYIGSGGNNRDLILTMQPGQIVTYGGVKHKVLVANRVGSDYGGISYSSLGAIPNRNAPQSYFLIAVPCL